MKPIVIAGPTAAGKTTHARLLAEQLTVPYFSASTVLRSLAKERHGWAEVWGGRWSPDLDRLRNEVDVDAEVDARMLSLLRDSPSGVFDAAILPWGEGVSEEAVCVWIESDLPSRTRKCYVSHLDNARVDIIEAKKVVLQKDKFTSDVLRRRYDAEYACDDRFHVVVDNSAFIHEATVASAVHGVALFSTILRRVVDFVSGASDELPRCGEVLRARHVA